MWGPTGFADMKLSELENVNASGRGMNGVSSIGSNLLFLVGSCTGILYSIC